MDEGGVGERSHQENRENQGKRRVIDQDDRKILHDTGPVMIHKLIFWTLPSRRIKEN